MSPTSTINLPLGSLSPLMTVGLGVGILLLVLAVEFARKRASYAHLPPGPKPNLLTGSVVPPSEPPGRAWYRLSKTYGPIFTLWSGTTPSIILNDVASATFFLEKNSRDTSDRPPHWAFVGDGKRVLMQPYNDRWRGMRRALHTLLAPARAAELRDYQEKSARGVILDLLGSSDFQNHISTYVATLTVHMAYGRTDRARYSDPDIAANVENGNRIGIMLRPGTNRLDAFPWLQYVPGYMRTINKWNSEELALFRKMLSGVTSASGKTASNPNFDLEACFASYLLEHKELNLSYDDIAYLCGSVFSAGSDTTSAALQIVIMAAVTNPDAQARVQKELDSLCHGQRPSFDEIGPEDAPTLHAFINETIRWRPVSAGGFAHRTTAPITYKDYVVPPGTLVTGNHYAIHRDESYYGPDVDKFNIDRWLSDGQLNKLKHFQYGFGRRSCPGLHVANNSVLINTALLLWSFDMRPKTGPDGKPIPIDTEAFANAANSHPHAFEVEFIPRHEGLEDLIRGADL